MKTADIEIHLAAEDLADVRAWLKTWDTPPFQLRVELVCHWQGNTTTRVRPLLEQEVASAKAARRIA